MARKDFIDELEEEVENTDASTKPLTCPECGSDQVSAVWTEAREWKTDAEVDLSHYDCTCRACKFSFTAWPELGE